MTVYLAYKVRKLRYIFNCELAAQIVWVFFVKILNLININNIKPFVGFSQTKTLGS
jgi:hypothetical protein